MEPGAEGAAAEGAAAEGAAAEGAAAEGEAAEEGIDGFIVVGPGGGGL